MCMMSPEFELGSYGVRFMWLLLFNSFNPFLPFHYNENDEQQVLNGKFVQSSVDKWPLKLKKVAWTHSPWSTEGTLSDKQRSGVWGAFNWMRNNIILSFWPRNFNQRNEGNSPVTLGSWEPAPSWSWCLSPWSQLLGGRRQRGRSLVKRALAVHSFLPTQVSRDDKNPKQFREARGWPSGRACVGHALDAQPICRSWRNPGQPSLPMSLLQWVPASHNIPNTVSPGILLTPLGISAKQTFVFPLFLFSTL